MEFVILLGIQSVALPGVPHFPPSSQAPPTSRSAQTLSILSPHPPNLTPGELGAFPQCHCSNLGLSQFWQLRLPASLLWARTECSSCWYLPANTNELAGSSEHEQGKVRKKA